MVTYVLRRTLVPVEWLSNNGEAYMAKNAVETATVLGLQPRSSLERWPEAKQQREDNPQSLQNVIMLVVDLA